MQLCIPQTLIRRYLLPFEVYTIFGTLYMMTFVADCTYHTRFATWKKKPKFKRLKVGRWDAF